MNILKMSDSVFNYYRKNVKGNSDISREQAELKITRNMHSAISNKARGKGNRVWYSYGNLRFLVVDEIRVVWMENQTATNKSWRIDWEKYNQLSEELGIENKHINKRTVKTLPVVEVQSTVVEEEFEGLRLFYEKIKNIFNKK